MVSSVDSLMKEPELGRRKVFEVNGILIMGVRG